MRGVHEEGEVGRAVDDGGKGKRRVKATVSAARDAEARKGKQRGKHGAGTGRKRAESGDRKERIERRAAEQRREI